jgi:hypothetical protein
MEKTFKKRRQMIEASPPLHLKRIKEKFPQLFTFHGIYQEFLRIKPGISLPSKLGTTDLTTGES